MTTKPHINDAVHRAIPVLKRDYGVAKTAEILGYSARTISEHSTATEIPSERKIKSDKRGPKTDEVAPYRDEILSLLQAANWRITAKSIHAHLVKQYGVRFSARTVQRFVKALKIEFELLKASPLTEPIRRRRGANLTDDEHRLILQLKDTVLAKTIAECLDCGERTVYRHINNPKLPSVKRKEQSFKGRRLSAEKLARYMIILYLLLLTRWTSTAKDIHHFIDTNFPQLTCSVKTVEREVKTIMIRAKVPKYVYAMRKKKPGEMVQLDMTDVSDLGVTIDGHAFPHRFAIATLPFSGYIHCEVVQGGESFEALQTTLINAITAFEGVPKLIQTDSLSAAYRNQCHDPEQDATENFFALCQQLGTLPIRINRQCPNENGSTESMNRHFATEVRDALVCRGSKDFASVADYQDFVGEVRQARNEKKKNC